MTGKNSDEFRKLKEDAENDLEKATELVNKLKEEYIKCIYNKDYKRLTGLVRSLDAAMIDLANVECRLKCILNLS